MRKCMLIALWLAVALLCLVGVFCFVFPGYRFTGFVCCAVLAVIGCYRLLLRLERRKPKTALRLRKLLTVCLCVFLLAYAVTGVVIISAANSVPEAECSHLIVLGAGVNGTVPSLSLRNRLDAALTYLQQHPNTVCIVSGGLGSGDTITEAECMFRYLTAAGIDPARIIKEEQATSTQENLRYSTKLVDADSIGIVSSEYHLYRAGLMARDLGLDPILIPARTTRTSLRMNYYMREVVALWYYLILGG